MAQIVENAQALAEALHGQGIPVWGADRGFTRTHQVIVDARPFGGGLKAARLLEAANIITNKNLLPVDQASDWDRPSGLRLGTTEVTRYGMRAPEMRRIAGLMADVLQRRQDPAAVQSAAVELRRAFPTLQFCFPLDC